MKLSSKLVLVLSLLGNFLVVAAVVICLVPLKQISYTVDVPYQAMETYTEMEPYSVTELVWEEQTLHLIPAIEQDVKIMMWLYWLIPTPPYPEKDTYLFGKAWYHGDGYTNFYIIDEYNWDRFKDDPYRQKPSPGWESILLFNHFSDVKWQFVPQAGVTYYFAFLSTGARDRKVGFEASVAWKEQVGKQITKYKQVEKQRTVWKVRTETHYKKVSILDYLINYKPLLSD